MKLIIDTNIWISFLIGHKVQTMQRLVADSRFEIYVCSQLMGEICDVARRKKIRKYITEEDVNDLLSIINAFCISTELKAEVPSSAIRDVNDLYLLSLAKAIGADYIVSGDADLTDLRCYEGTHILKLADFMQLMDI